MANDIVSKDQLNEREQIAREQPWYSNFFRESYNKILLAEGSLTEDIT